MFAIIDFIHVRMDKHIQAAEKIQAQVLEPFFFFVVYVPISPLFLYHFQMYMCVFHRHPCKHSNGTGLCRSGWAKVQSRLTQ